MVEIIFNSRLEQRQVEFSAATEKKIHDKICVFRSAQEGGSWNSTRENKGKVRILLFKGASEKIGKVWRKRQMSVSFPHQQLGC